MACIPYSICSVLECNLETVPWFGVWLMLIWITGNNVTSNLKWDLGGRNIIAGLLKVIKFSQGRFLELGASYSDKTQLLMLEGAGKPHKDHKLFVS